MWRRSKNSEKMYNFQPPKFKDLDDFQLTKYVHGQLYLLHTLEQFLSNSNLSGGENGACSTFWNCQSFKISPHMTYVSLRPLSFTVAYDL